VAGQPYYLYSTSCLVICPTATYPDFGSLTCIACTLPCTTCSGGTSICTSCDSTSATPYLKYGLNLCAAACPDGQYAPTSSFTCALCDSNCLTCSTTSTYCLTCGLSLSSGLPLYLSNNTCLATCSFGYYGASGNACSSCDTSCLGCTQSSTNCISCASTYFRKAGSTLCLGTCPDGYYADSGTNLCTLCPLGCKLCSMNTSVSCSVCMAAAGVQYYLDSTTNTCVPQCPSTYYPSVSSTPSCNACSGNCATCLDASNCITCIANTYLGYGETTCYSACPNGQYNATGSGKCQNCNTFCATCSATATTCLTCTSLGGVAYFLSNSTCTATCPSG
jgi:proprotein convertase subtilisin/kexin type 5